MSIQSRLTSVGKTSALKKEAFLDTSTKISQPSGFAPFETLFNEFNLQVTPTFNFWTEDELVNSNISLEKGQQLFDIPRYITLNWKASPLLKNESSPNKQFKSSVKQNGNSVTINGAVFSVDHLSPEHFEDVVCKNLIDVSQIKPGIIASIVDLPIQKNKIKDEIEIDESSILEDGEFYGIPISDLVNNVSQLTQDYTTEEWMSARIASDTQKLKEKYFDKNTTIKFPVKETGFLRIESIDCPSLKIKISRSDTKQNNKNIFLETIERVTKQTYEDKDEVFDSIPTKVNFIQTNLTSRSTNKSLSHHEEAKFILNSIVPNLNSANEAQILNNIRSLDVPSLPSPPGLTELEYVGYVIEKYEKISDIFKLVETIFIPRREFNQYVDTKVKYSTLYRYRMKGILRWTRKKDIDISGLTKKGQTNDLVINQTINSINGFADLYESSYFTSQWNEEWQYASVIDNVSPSWPDELNVKPNSARKFIEITMKFPDNSQKDIMTMVLLRKQNKSDKFKPIATFNKNTRFLDYDVEYDKDYIYTSLCYSKHDQYSDYSEQYLVKLNSDYATKGEHLVRMISCAGVCRDLIGSFTTNPPIRNASELIAPVSINKYLDEAQSNFSFSIRETESKGLKNGNTYCIKVESLDTGEKKDFYLSTSYTTLPLK